MWSSLKTDIEKGLSKYKISQNGKVITFQEAIELLRNSNEFVIFFIDLLRGSSYNGFFWEVRPISLEKIHEEFEFVLVDSLALSKINPDNSSFIKYFKENKFVTSFLNLNGDSKLIVPIEISDSNNYSHLAKFVRNAPHEQVEIFWKMVGEEVSKSLGTQTKWLSTSGLGVHWLHVRIDSRPKYYNYQPYKEI